MRTTGILISGIGSGHVYNYGNMFVAIERE